MRWAFLFGSIAAVALASPDSGELQARATEFGAVHDRYQQLLTQRATLRARAADLDTRIRSAVEHEGLDPAEGKRLAKEHEAAQGALAEFEAPRGELWKTRVKVEALATKLELDLDTAIDLEATPLLHLLRGELMARLERFGAALPDAEAAAFAEPENARALLLLGRCAATQNRFKDAEGLFGEAVRHEPSAEGWALLAVARYCRNRFRAAGQAFANADPEQVSPRLLRRCRQWFEPAALKALEVAWAKEQTLRETAQAQPRIALSLGEREVVIELFANSAPEPVASVLARVRAGKLKDVPVQRVLTNLAVFAGASARRDPAEQVVFEAEKAPRHHFRGSVSLERRGDASRYGPGLVISLTPAPRLDARHLVIGRVVSGQAAWDAAQEGQRLTAARVLE